MKGGNASAEVAISVQVGGGPWAVRNDVTVGMAPVFCVVPRCRWVVGGSCVLLFFLFRAGCLSVQWVISHHHDLSGQPTGVKIHAYVCVLSARAAAQRACQDV